MIHDLVQWCWWVSFGTTSVVILLTLLLMARDRFEEWRTRRELAREPLDWSPDDGR